MTANGKTSDRWQPSELGDTRSMLVGDDETSPTIETLVVAAEAALSRGAPMPMPFDGELTLAELTELHEMQSCLLLLNEARREGWLEEIAGRSPTMAPEHRQWPESQAAFDGNQRIGRFEIVRELGRGGHGVVFLARDPSLRRLVALKVARPESLVSDDLRRRFQREAEAAGGLRHPNVIEVYEIGAAGPISYIASAYCGGPTLQQWLADAGLQASEREAAATVVAIAQGVAHAHAAGVLHRDIKPSNVLLDSPAEGARLELPPTLRPSEPLGSYTPKLGDFGLAKLLDSQDDQTRTGSTLGTPAYMAPEQASGRLDRIGPATDVYGLGVLLYELLVGRPPLRGENDIDTARRVCEEEPISPRRLRPSLDPDLEAICLHCLEKEPAGRYATAQALVDDLSRYLAGKPTLVRPLGPARTALRWIKRRPLPAALMAVSLALVVVLAGGGWWTSLQNEQALRRESALRSQAEAKESEAAASSAETRRLLYASDLRVAHQLSRNGQLKTARELLQSHVPRSGELDLREFAWHYLNRRTQPEIVTFRGHTDGVRMGVVSPDGFQLVTVGKEGTAKLWDVARGEERFTFPTGDITVAAFSCDGQRLAVATKESVYVYSLADLSHPVQLSHECGEPKSLAFSWPVASLDEEMLAIGGDARKVSVWLIAAAQLLPSVPPLADPVADVTFSRQNELVIAAGKRVEFYRPADATQMDASFEVDEAVTCVAFSTAEHGKVAVGCASGRTMVRSLASDAADLELRQAGAVTAAVFHPNGRLLATASAEGLAKIWELATGQCVKEFVGHTDRVNSAAFIHNGSQLMTASDDGSVKICRIEDACFRVVDWSNFGVNAIDFSSDSAKFFWTGHPTSGGVPYCSGTVDLPSLGTRALHGAAGSFADLQCLASPRRLITVDNIGGRCDIDLTALPVVPQSFPAPVGQSMWAPKLAATADGKTIVWGDRYPLRLIRARKERTESVGPGEVAHVAEMRINPVTNDYVVVASEMTLARWDLATRTQTHCWKMPTTLRGFDFIDKDRLAWVGADEVLRIIDLETGNLRDSFPSNDGSIRSVAIHPNGRTLALGHVNGLISLWDLSVNRQLLSLDEHRAEVTQLKFSPDGQYLASASAPGQIFIWPAVTPAETPAKDESTVAVETDVVVSSVRPTSARSQPVRLPSTIQIELDDVPERFRRINDYAQSLGYSTAFPTFVDRETDDGILVGAVALKRGMCQWHEVLARDVTAMAANSDFAEQSLRHLQRTVAWGRTQQHSLALSNFHQAMAVHQIIYGTGVIHPSAYRLGQVSSMSPDDADTLSERLRLINRQAIRQGDVGGIPTFEDRIATNSFGVAFFSPDVAERLQIPAYLLKK